MIQFFQEPRSHDHTCHADAGNPFLVIRTETDSIDFSRIGREELIKLSLAYTCLVHRVLLKVLGYSGTYIDYSLKERPEKSLTQIVGE